jgi:hypothetical protein
LPERRESGARIENKNHAFSNRRTDPHEAGVMEWDRMLEELPLHFYPEGCQGLSRSYYSLETLERKRGIPAADEEIPF